MEAGGSGLATEELIESLDKIVSDVRDLWRAEREANENDDNENGDE